MIKYYVKKLRTNLHKSAIFPKLYLHLYDYILKIGIEFHIYAFSIGKVNFTLVNMCCKSNG